MKIVNWERAGCEKAEKKRKNQTPIRNLHNWEIAKNRYGSALPPKCSRVRERKRKEPDRQRIYSWEENHEMGFLNKLTFRGMGSRKTMRRAYVKNRAITFGFQKKRILTAFGKKCLRVLKWIYRRGRNLYGRKLEFQGVLL